MKRHDVYNTQADKALEVAIASMMDYVETVVDGVASSTYRNMSRAEALRFLVKRATKKLIFNKTRRIVAASGTGEAVS